LNIKEYLAIKKELIDEALDKYLPDKQEMPGIIHEAMRYSVFAGGKRLRPILVLASAEAVGGDPQKLLPAACALEMIHTYSLIHDDLPAMDDDDYRRGKLTSHKVFGEAVAILAGDALLTHAFGVLAECADSIDPGKVCRVIAEVSRAAGSLGMVGGQVVDILSEGKQVSKETVDYIHRHKTAALFRAALRMGAILSGAEQSQLNSLTAYAEHLGLAFQIMDDILDVTGDTNKLGKRTGSDAKKKKATFPSLYGLEKARGIALEESRRAVESVKDLGPAADPLREIARYLVLRDC